MRCIPEGQQRIVYEHEKKGRIHRHVVWNRIDTENMRAFPDSLDLKVCEAAKHEIEAELELQKTPGLLKRDPELPPPERNPPSWEMFRGQKSGIDPRDVKSEVTAIFRESANAADFAAGLEAHGYQLCIGDRRDFVILDSAGDTHSLARRLEGVKAKELKAFMEGTDRAALPSVEQGKEKQWERSAENRAAELSDVQKEIQWEDALANAAIEKEKIERRFVEPTERGTLARGSTGKEPDNQNWPTLPPQPEQIVTSPAYHFTDAARATANDNRPEAAPENMGRTGAAIWLAYTQSQAPQDFAAALEQEGMALAVVTTDEAERSHREAEFAKEIGNRAPRYGAGEIVVVSQAAHVYRLDEKRTGDDRAQVERFLAPLDRSPLQGIEATKEIMQERAETREADNLRKARSRVTPDEAERGPDRGGLVAHQMWALERVRDADQQRREQQDRREYSEKQKRDSAEPDSERYRTDPEYRRQVQNEKAYKSPEEKKRDRENDVRAQIEQHDRGRG